MSSLIFIQEALVIVICIGLCFYVLYRIDPPASDSDKSLKEEDLSIQGYYSDIRKWKDCNGNLRVGNGESFFFHQNNKVDIYFRSNKNTTATWQIINGCLQVRDDSPCFPQNFNFTIEQSGLVLRDKTRGMVLGKE